MENPRLNVNTVLNKVTRTVLVVLAGVATGVSPLWGTTTLHVGSSSYDPGYVSSVTNAILEKTATTNISTSYPVTNPDRSGSITVTASGHAEVGLLKLKATGQSVAQTSAGSWNAIEPTTAYAQWQDSLTVDAGQTWTGQSGQLIAKIVIDGSLALGDGDPYAGTGLANQAGSYFFISATWNGVKGTYGGTNTFEGGSALRFVSGGATATTAYQGNLIGPGEWQVTFPITFGQQGTLNFTAETIADARSVVYSSADGLRQGSSTGDFSSGVKWAGILVVRTANGTNVPQFSVSSTSGFNYLGGIPTEAPSFTQILDSPAGLILKWTDSVLRSYTVETRASLTTGNWAPAAGVVWPVTTNAVTLPAQTASSAFFRLKAQ